VAFVIFSKTHVVPLQHDLASGVPAKEFTGVLSAARNAMRNADCSEHGSAWISRRVEEMRARVLARAHYVKRPSGRVYVRCHLAVRARRRRLDPRTVPLRKRYADTARGGPRARPPCIRDVALSRDREGLGQFFHRNFSLPKISLRLKVSIGHHLAR